MTNSSRCVFCSSTSYGKGCRYSPQGVHFHPDNPLKCSFCGSTSYGKGCRINPSGDIHIHGIAFNSVMKEKLTNTMLNQLILHELKRPFTEFAAYKLNLIDENGNKLKEAITEDEKFAVSPFNKTLIQLKRFMGSKMDLMHGISIVENEKILDISAEKYEKVLNYEERINNIFEEFHALIDEAIRDNMSFEVIEALIR